MTRGKLPQARNEDIVTQPLGDELLVYDRRADRAHALDPVAAFVFRRSNGQTSVAEIAESLPAPLGGENAEHSVRHALQCLTGADLLEAGTTSGSPRLAHRRSVLKQAAMAGGLTATSYTLLSLIAPTPAQAQASDFGSGPGEQDSDSDPTLEDPTYPDGQPSGKGGITDRGPKSPQATQRAGEGSTEPPRGGPGDGGEAQVSSPTQSGAGPASGGSGAPQTTGSTPTPESDTQPLTSLSAESSQPAKGAGGMGGGGGGGGGGSSSAGSSSAGSGGAGGGGDGGGSAGQSSASSKGTGTTSGANAGPSAGSGSGGVPKKQHGRRIC